MKRKTSKIFCIIGFAILFGLAALCLSSCAAKRWEVRFETNGGNEIAPIYFFEGQWVEVKEIFPLKENYEFGGWYLDSALKQKFEAAKGGVRASDNIVLYAKWLPMYRVTGDGTVELVQGHIRGYERYDVLATYGGLPVVRIAANAFEGSEITEITFPGSLIEIGDYAFSAAKNLSRAAIPSSVRVIGNYAFRGSGLTVLTFDEECDFDVIGVCAFSECNITELIVPPSKNFGGFVWGTNPFVKVTIGESVNLYNYTGTSSESLFQNCNAIEEVVLGNPFVDLAGMFSGTPYLQNLEQAYKNETFYVGDTAVKQFDVPINVSSVSVKEGTRAIAPGCFEKAGISSVTLPDTVERIGAWAFYGTSLTEFRFPSALREIGYTALPNTLKGLTVLPDNLEYVGRSVFQNQDFVALPASLKYVDDSAFKGCTKLQSIPASLKYAGAGAFQDCTALSEVPYGIETVGDSAFAGCTMLQSIPASLKSIGVSAFEGCTALSDVPGGIRSVGGRAFFGTPWQAAQGDGVVYYGTAVIGFNGEVPNDGAITIKAGTTRIGERVFMDLPISSVAFPRSLLSIGDSAFSGCKLRSLTLPDRLITIGSQAFMKNNLIDIVLPDSVVSVGYSAFDLNISLSTLKLSANIKDFSENIYVNIAKIWIPKGYPSIPSSRGISFNNTYQEIYFEADAEDAPDATDYVNKGVKVYYGVGKDQAF